MLHECCREHLESNPNELIKMEKNHIIIIILVILIVIAAAGIGFTLFSNKNIEYKTINLSNGTTIEVPVSDDATFTKDDVGLRTYISKSLKTVLTSFNSEEDWDLAGGIAFAGLRDSLIGQANTVETFNEYTIKETEVNDTHYYVAVVRNDNSHDNIIILSSDLDILRHVLGSIHFGTPASKNNNTTEQNVVTSTPTSTENTQTKNNTEGEYGGFTKEEAIYREGLADGHRQAEEALRNDRGIDDTGAISDSGSSNVETTTDSGSSSDSGSSNVETTADSGSSESGPLV